MATSSPVRRGVTCAICDGLGAPEPGAPPQSMPCRRCRRSLTSVDSLPVLDDVTRFGARWEWDAGSRAVVTALKYRRARRLVPWLAWELEFAMAGWGADVELVTWLPTTPARLRRRGFDQAELLARGLARRMRRPCRRVLARDPSPAQTGAAADQRAKGPRLRVIRPVPATVLVVDDVCTTGSSLRRAARALRAAGSDEVGATVLALVRTPAGAGLPIAAAGDQVAHVG